jgi:hypothetical protein
MVAGREGDALEPAVGREQGLRLSAKSSPFDSPPVVAAAQRRGLGNGATVDQRLSQAADGFDHDARVLTFDSKGDPGAVSGNHRLDHDRAGHGGGGQAELLPVGPGARRKRRCGDLLHGRRQLGWPRPQDRDVHPGEARVLPVLVPRRAAHGQELVAAALQLLGELVEVLFVCPGQEAPRVRERQPRGGDALQAPGLAPGGLRQRRSGGDRRDARRASCSHGPYLTSPPMTPSPLPHPTREPRRG